MIKIEFGEQEEKIKELHLAYYRQYIEPKINQAIDEPNISFWKDKDCTKECKKLVDQHRTFLKYVSQHICNFAIGSVEELDELKRCIEADYFPRCEEAQQNDKELYVKVKEKKQTYIHYLQQLFGYEEFKTKSFYEVVKSAAIAKRAKEKQEKNSNTDITELKKETYNSDVYEEMIKILYESFPHKQEIFDSFPPKKSYLKNGEFEKVFQMLGNLDITYLNLHEHLAVFGGRWNPYYFVLLSGIRVCPYCNAQYITPILSPTGKMRADLDHFYPKGQYPYFSMSLFNLIPVCKSCNSSLKGEKELSSKVHPYKASVNDLFSFRVHLQTQQLQILQHHEVVRDYLELFKIEATASYHAGQVEELLFKQRAYPKSYLKELAAQTRTTVRYVKTQAIGYVQDEKSLNDSTFAKLRRDVAKQLNFIEPIDDDTKAKLRKLAKQLGHE
ncbi:HNH endonuclease domain-containing protein [Caryophanon latum]|uniref:Uncharacterized protein n=1 Tax=Caryophanon latum TaxID=33977 RepID=A0A1C0YV70_9BACL|nr:HNH endonuclease domain-containing protein [Caryophanon latum]OCS91059.1 hypothetical protein A6K76_09960 [Caryophanon latum]